MKIEFNFFKYIVFKMFSSDGLYIKATEFVGLGKLLKIHPVINK